jgi:hypothetical protein
MDRCDGPLAEEGHQFALRPAVHVADADAHAPAVITRRDPAETVPTAGNDLAEVRDEG